MERQEYIEIFLKMPFYELWTKNLDKNDIEFLSENPISEWINWAFTWDSTEQGHNFWSKIDKFWTTFFKSGKNDPATFFYLLPKELNINIDTTPHSLNIGVEWEFWTNNIIQSDIIEKYGIVTEYYSGMFEVNSFLKRNITSEKEIFDFFTEVLEKMKEIKKEIGKTKISTRGIQVDKKSIVFNGLHIHISINNKDGQEIYYPLEKIRNKWKEIIKFKLEELPSFRALHSHHIWGGLRYYEYNYKRKRRFKPIIVTSIPTVELRCFDTEDIIYKTQRKKISKFIWNLFRNIEEPPKDIAIPYQDDGEDIGQLYKLCFEHFSQETTNKHKIIEINEEKEIMLLQANYQKIAIDKQNNRINLIN